MSYRTLKPKHDRSHSVDIANDIVAMINHSHLGANSDAKNPYPGRSTPKSKVKLNDISNTHLDDPQPHSNDSSPLKPLKLNHIFGARSQNNSAVKGPSSKFSKLERVASVYLTGPPEPENSVSKAIQIAFELQAERERELFNTRTRLETEVTRLKLVTDSFQDKITAHKQNCESKNDNLHLLQVLSDQGIVDLEDLLMQDPLKRKELINVLTKINRSIIMDYRHLQSQNEKRMDSCESTSEGNISVLISHPTIDILQNFLDDKNLLLHKVEQAEEKLNQAREVRNMIEEDFNSHVNSNTEFIFAQEEAENMLETLKIKYPGSFHLVMQDVELEKMCSSLDVDYANKYSSYTNLSHQVSEEQIKHAILQEQDKDISRTIESLRDSLETIGSDILFPLLPLQDRLEEAMKMIPINLEEIRSRILAFFAAFDARGKLGLNENSDLDEKHAAILYQHELLEETLTVLKFKKDIQNLESTMFKLHNKNVPADSENQILKSIQSEIINKKVTMTQKTSDIEINKRKMAKTTPFTEFLVPHSDLSFLELSKKYTAYFESAISQKLEQVLLILLTSIKDTYSSYFAVKETHTKNQEKASLILNDFKGQARILDSLQLALTKTKEELHIIKKNQECYRAKQAEIKEKFETFAANNGSRSFREPTSSQKGGTPSKSPSKDGSAPNTPRKNTFAKVKREIQEAFSTIHKVEVLRNQKSNIIETLLRPNFEKSRGQLVEFRSKIGFLNKEVLILIDKEQEFYRTFEKQIYEAGLLTTNEDEYVILNRLYMSTQDYITGLCELMCTILQAYFMEERPERALSLNKSEISDILRQQQDRLKTMMDVDQKKIQEYDLQLKTQLPVLNERSEKLAFVKDQLQKSKHFCEVTDQLLKNQDKENCPASVNTSFANESGCKKLVSSKSSSKLQNIGNQASAQKGISPNLKLNFDLTNQKTNENRPTYISNISAFDGPSSRGNLSKNPSTASISPYNSQTRPNQSDRSSLLKDENYASHNSKVDKTVHKNLYIEPNRYLDAIRDFELGFPLWKKFSATSNLVSLKSELEKLQPPILKGFGKRTFRVNIVQKTVEVIKINSIGSRPQVEYSYDWKHIKKLFIPSKTLETLKRTGGMNRDTNEYLSFALDVKDKGRVDFLSTNPFYIIVLWNFVNQILSNGTMVVPHN